MRRTKCLAYFVVLQTTFFLLLATLNNYSYRNIYVKKYKIIDGFSCLSAPDSVNKSRVIQDFSVNKSRVISANISRVIQDISVNISRVIQDISVNKSRVISANKSRVIPKHIHQMFFYVTDKTLPEKLNSARKTWEYNHNGFKYTLWNASMVEELLEERYPQLLDLYHSYGHWVRRADMARYIVLYEYGGLYIDLDIKSTGKQLNDLYKTFKSTTDIVLYLTSPPVVSNDFMIAKRKHPFMRHVVCGLESANRWYVLPYVTTMYTTGPMFLNAQYKSYSEKQEIHLLEQPVMRKFVRHMTGSSWHQWDGVVIWWTFSHLRQVLSGILLAVTLVGIILLFIRKRMYQRIKCAQGRYGTK